MRKKKNPNDLTLSGHLKELKHRVIICLIVFIVIFIAAYLNCNKLLEFVMKTGKEIGYDFVYLAPQEVILQQFRIAAVIAIICDLPIIIYELVAFVSPVFESKKSFLSLLLLGIIAIILFLLGTVFAYKILLPFVYKFLFDIGETSKINAQISIKEYISLFLPLFISEYR